MIIYKNLIIVGTSHISAESVKEVEKVIKIKDPEVVALELDKGRFYSLMHDKERRMRIRDIRKVGFKGYLFALIGQYIEKRLGARVGVSPGSEMMKAAEVASKVGSKVALIDQDIRITLKNLSKGITRREKFRFLIDIFRSPLKREKVSIDLRKVPGKKLIKKLLGIVKERYPNVYRVLVSDRNKYMAKKLFKLMKNYSLIVAVVGAGHEEEIIDEIKNLERAN